MVVEAALGEYQMTEIWDSFDMARDFEEKFWWEVFEAGHGRLER